MAQVPDKAEMALAAMIAELEALQAGTLPADHFYRPVPSVRRADGAWSLPYYDYEAAMERLWACFASAGFVAEPADYRAWLETADAPFDPSNIARMERPDLMMLLLAIRRGERFCDGHWAEVLDRGVFLAIARRLRELESAQQP